MYRRFSIPISAFPSARMSIKISIEYEIKRFVKKKRKHIES